jgi:hypothetical protein
MDLPIVDDDLILPRRHDRRADWHLLYLEAIGGFLVVFSDPKIVGQRGKQLYEAEGTGQQEIDWSK